MNTPADDEPLDLDRVDQEIRINNLRNQIEDVTGEELVMNKASDLPPDLEEEFLKHMLIIEECAEEPAFGVLEAEGVSLPSPDELDDAALHEVLWKVIHACARHRLYFHHTNHLSDREFYSHLWHEAFRRGLTGFGLPYGNCQYDMIGTGSEEHILLGQRFYDDDEERAWWVKQFPDYELPPRGKPPFDRDRLMPKANYD
ncbi:MAG: hypothetical protein ACAH88_15455 [Roseimicrobium sp.]